MHNEVKDLFVNEGWLFRCDERLLQSRTPSNLLIFITAMRVWQREGYFAEIGNIHFKIH
jgi:hypothetical protein